MQRMSSVHSVRFRLAVIAFFTTVLLLACGTDGDSVFTTGEGPDGGDGTGSSSGQFNNPGTIDGGGGTSTCKPRTCAEQGIECGPAGDGCGGLIAECGKCGAGLRCGGPGAPSKCVSPSVGTGCVPKTCAELGIGCGLAGDGCGGLLTCPTCAPGMQCGSNASPSQCVPANPIGADGGACVPKTCDDYKADNKDCGVQSNGCGGTIDCGSCVAPEFCGGGGPSKCAVSGGGACVKKTCADYTGKCGPQPDGCGGVTDNCGTCTSPQVCGGGGTASVCGGGGPLGPDAQACVPKTVASCGPNECGKIADGCGGIVDCGTAKCVNGTICGGGGVANQCGAPACDKITACPAGMNCGSIADGCGGTVTCGATGNCQAPQSCGGGGKPNVCGGGVITADGGVGGGTCVPKTTCPPKACGPIADGCGDVIPCGNCTSPEVCGAGAPSVCGGGDQCTKKTKAAACGTTNCGYQPDGCGGSYACGLVVAGADTPNCPDAQICGLYTANQCGSLSGPCVGTGVACANNSDCCSGFCGADGLCKVSACLGDGTTCTGNAQCCSGKCGANGTGSCQAINGGVCKGSGNACTAGSECCSKVCTGGVCDAVASFCRQLNDTCLNDAQCCNGKCTKAAGALAGRCQDIPISGIGTCNVAGTVVPCTNLGGNEYSCEQACCSKACGKTGATDGVAICQQPSGCGPQGELCRFDSDCCGWSGQGGPSGGAANYCSKISQTDEFGKCAGGNACSEPGEICKSAVDACSVSNNCCEPIGMPSGNCNSNPAACCKLDSLGIPRCIRTYVCAQQGEECVSSADCCNQRPCTLDSQTGKKKCGPQCISDGQNCSVNEDCCGGNCYKATPGATNGTCKIPECIPKTCANYPGLCGRQSDGCGDLTAECNPCTAPQFCGGGGPSKCGGGVGCTPETCTSQGADCGVVPNGCGQLLTCPDCTGGLTCGGGGKANKCGTASCNPLTCLQQGIECGQTGDGCGNLITCPTCPAGTTCGGGGVPNKCGAPACVKLTTCPAGKNCGDYPDGCGGSIHCGDCPDGQTCGGGGAPNVCGAASCSAKSCVDQGKQCGTISDLCGGVLTCPLCGPNQFCNGQNLCVGLTCVPKTCTDLGIQCGPTADGCGGVLDCGNCPAGTGCGAGGTPGKCGTNPCTPKTCNDLKAVCGKVADGCGGLTPDCGTCAGNLACKNGACVQACTPVTCAAVGAQCGPIADGCGGSLDCGPCQPGEICGYNNQANKCGAPAPK